MSQKKLDRLLEDYRNICQNLLKMQETEGKIQLSINLVDLINQIADYVIPKENPVRERIGAIMGGKILQLASERFIEEGRTLGITEGRTLGITEGRTLGITEGRTLGITEGRTLGIEEGRVKELCSMIQDGDITLERAAKRLNITVPELEKRMLENGYQLREM
jgi:flagellar biosynthesis/type III secretory pathway protein FliH